MILSNQVTCNKCGDEIYSAHRHDFKTCSCGNVSVDGGMEYNRRVFKTKDFTEQSIELEDDLVKAMIEQGDWCLETGRNGLGIACAIARAIRDSGYEIVKKNDT